MDRDRVTAGDPIADLALELLAERSWDRDDLVRELAHRGAFDEFGHDDDDDTEAGTEDLDDEQIASLGGVLDEVLFDLEHVWPTPGRWMRTDVAIDATMQTHRVTAAEVTDGALLHGTDLDLVTFTHAGAIEFVDGGALDLSFGDLDDDPGSTVRLRGPDGWLDDITPGSLIGLRHVGRRVELVRDVPEPDDDANRRAADALRAAFEARVPPGLGVEPEIVAMDALGSDPGAFRVPVAPMTELLELAGLRERDDSVGQADEEFRTQAELRFAERRDEMAAAYGLERCCRDAFERVAVLLDHVDAPVPDTAGADVHHDPRVEQALADLVAPPGGGPHVRAHSLARRLVDAGRDTAGVGHHLHAAIALREHRAVDALAAANAAVAIEGDQGPAAALVARLIADSGDAAGALERWRRIPEAPHRDLHVGMLTRIVAPHTSVGRNDPCPCGSGRKYKQCCLRAPKVTDADRRRLALHQVRSYVLTEHRDEVFHLALHAFRHEHDLADDDDLSGVDEAEFTRGVLGWMEQPIVVDALVHEGRRGLEYLAERGDLIPDAELEWLDVVVSAPLRLWEVDRAEDGTLTARDLLADDRTVHGVDPGDVAPESWREPRLVVGRLLVDGTDGSPGFVGPAVGVPRVGVVGAVELVTGVERPQDVVTWYVDRAEPTPFLDDDGSPRMLVEMRYVAGDHADADELIDALDDWFGPAEGGTWRDRVTFADGTHLDTAVLRRDDDRLVVQAPTVASAAAWFPELSELGLELEHSGPTAEFVAHLDRLRASTAELLAGDDEQLPDDDEQLPDDDGADD